MKHVSIEETTSLQANQISGFHPKFEGSCHVVIKVWQAVSDPIAASNLALFLIKGYDIDTMALFIC